MRLLFVVAALLACSGCESEAPSDAAILDETHFAVWAGVPGGTATIGGASVPLSNDGFGLVMVAPRFVGTAATLQLTRGEQMLELPVEWAREYDAAGIPPGEPLESLQVRVVRDETDGSCALSETSGRAGGQVWSGARSRLIVACGPFVGPPDP